MSYHFIVTGNASWSEFWSAIEPYQLSAVPVMFVRSGGVGVSTELYALLFL